MESEQHLKAALSIANNRDNLRLYVIYILSEVLMIKSQGKDTKTVVMSMQQLLSMLFLLLIFFLTSRHSQKCRSSTVVAHFSAVRRPGCRHSLCESRFLDAVNVRLGVGFYLVSCCFVANCAVHQWSVIPEGASLRVCLSCLFGAPGRFQVKVVVQVFHTKSRLDL